MGRCHACGTEVSSTVTIGHASTCAGCGKPLKVCLNCRFYDPNAYHECKEDVPEPVIYKDQTNFCDFFVMAESSDKEQIKSRQEARSRFLSLFNDE